MISINREINQSVMIGDDIEVGILDIRKNKVRLFITAPPSVPIHRTEVYDAIKREKKARLKMEKYRNQP